MPNLYFTKSSVFQRFIDDGIIDFQNNQPNSNLSRKVELSPSRIRNTPFEYGTSVNVRLTVEKTHPKQAFQQFSRFTKEINIRYSTVLQGIRKKNDTKSCFQKSLHNYCLFINGIERRVFNTDSLN